MGSQSNGQPLFLRRLEGKVAIITGGAAGAGEATARLFVQHGAKVVIVDIRDDLGRSVAAKIGDEAAISYVHCDVSVEDDVRAAVEFAVAKYGRLDIMFNNAAVLGTRRPRIAEDGADEFARVLAVNVTGVFLGTKHAARAMAPGGGGSIINNGSVASVIGGVASHAYVASKHAVIGLTRSAAAELGRRGVRVNCVSPFAYGTELTNDLFQLDSEGIEAKIGGLGNMKGVVLKAQDVANAALFLASDEAKYVSGHNLVIDGGFTVANHSFGLFD